MGFGRPGVSQYDPGVQLEQSKIDEIPEIEEYFPAGQSEGFEEPSGQYDPAGHKFC